MDRGKTDLLNAIRTQFADARPGDVSVIYICCHGHYSYGGVSEYVLVTSAYTKSKSRDDLISGTELMAAVSTIPGKVVLILDSCYSGAFLDKFAGRAAANPNLAVICSSHGDTRSSYWNVTGRNSVDFFTYALLEGLGYEEKTGARLSLNADVNGDGVVTVAEAAAYATSKTQIYVAQYSGNAKFHGSAEQLPRYTVTGMENVPLVGR